MSIKPASKVLDFARRCSHTFPDLQDVYGYLSELLSCANDDKLRFPIIQSEPVPEHPIPDVLDQCSFAWHQRRRTAAAQHWSRH